MSLVRVGIIWHLPSIYHSSEPVTIGNGEEKYILRKGNYYVLGNCYWSEGKCHRPYLESIDHNVKETVNQECWGKLSVIELLRRLKREKEEENNENRKGGSKDPTRTSFRISFQFEGQKGAFRNIECT